MVHYLDAPHLARHRLTVLPLPQRGTPPANPALVSAIAGPNLPPNSAPTTAPARQSRARLPKWLRAHRLPFLAPSPAGVPPGLPNTYFSDWQVTPRQLQAVLAVRGSLPSQNGDVRHDSAARTGAIIQRSRRNTPSTPGTGQQSFIPRKSSQEIKSAGGTEIEGRGIVLHWARDILSCSNTATGSTANSAAPSSSGTGTNLAHPALAQPDLSSMGAIGLTM